MYQFVFLKNSNEHHFIPYPTLKPEFTNDDNENDDIGYLIRITNLISLYEERLSSHDIFQLCTKLNPNVEVPEIVDVIEHLDEMLESKSNAKNVILSDSGKISDNYSYRSQSSCKLTMIGEISGYEFRWEFTLKLLDPVTFYYGLTKPAITVLTLLIENQSNLINIIESKDKEIQNYIENGAELSRKTLKTNEFKREKDSFCLPSSFQGLSISNGITSSKFNQVLKAYQIKQLDGYSLSQQTQLQSDNEDFTEIKSQFLCTQNERLKKPQKVSSLSTASQMKAPKPIQSSQTQGTQMSGKIRKALRKL